MSNGMAVANNGLEKTKKGIVVCFMVLLQKLFRRIKENCENFRAADLWISF
jgi:hypothetical protein